MSTGRGFLIQCEGFCCLFVFGSTQESAVRRSNDMNPLNNVESMKKIIGEKSMVVTVINKI